MEGKRARDTGDGDAFMRLFTWNVGFGRDHSTLIENLVFKDVHTEQDFGMI